MRTRILFLLAMVLAAAAGPASAKAPDWLQELAARPVPQQAADVDAVQLSSVVELTVTNGELRKRVRGAVRILRREGLQRAVLSVGNDSWSKVQQMRAWAIPVSGKTTEVRMKDAIETSLTNVRGGELITDARMRVLRVPDAAIGTTVGYEFEIVQSPLEMADTFRFQDTIPVLEARYLLQLPPGWTLATTWINHSGREPERNGANQWTWTLREIPAVAIEPAMPAWPGLAGQLFVAFAPANTTPQLSTWQGISSWFLDLSRDRRVATPQVREKAAELLAGRTSPLERIQALATFVQRDIRYVGIQLGIGGFQPHAATDILRNRYGDCKDKAVLLNVLLAEAGIDSLPVLVHTERLHVRPQMPPSLRFNHMILAIRLPADAQATTLLATATQADGSRLLFFDPTDEVTALGRLPAALQGGHGLLVLAQDSHLVQLPQLLPGQNGARRTARMRLDAAGNLAGEVVESFRGEHANLQRRFLRGVAREQDMIKPLEARLAESLANFRITSASVSNEGTSELPLEWRFSLAAESYARRAGELVMVRPRLLASSVDQLPGGELARVHDLLLSEPRADHDEYVIELPAGYVPDSLPEPVELDVGFAAYRSRTEVSGSQLRYSRSFEVRESLVPAAKIEDYRRLQREIARDERAVVLLKHSTGS